MHPAEQGEWTAQMPATGQIREHDSYSGSSLQELRASYRSVPDLSRRLSAVSTTFHRIALEVCSMTSPAPSEKLKTSSLISVGTLESRL